MALRFLLLGWKTVDIASNIEIGETATRDIERNMLKYSSVVNIQLCLFMLDDEQMLKDERVRGGMMYQEKMAWIISF